MSYWILGNEPPTQAPKSSTCRRTRRRSATGALARDLRAAASSSRTATASTSSTGGPATIPPRRSAPAASATRSPTATGHSDHHNITYYYPGGIEGWLISIKHTAGFRDVKEQFYGSKGMLELARTYYKWHGPDPLAPLKNADDLRDRCLIERGDSKREITIDAIAVLLQEHRRQEALQRGAGRRRQHFRRAARPHGLRDQARSDVGRTDEELSCHIRKLSVSVWSSICLYTGSPPEWPA